VFERGRCAITREFVRKSYDRTSVALHERGYRVVAVDLASSLLATARARYPAVDFRLMDARRLEVLLRHGV